MGVPTLELGSPPTRRSLLWAAIAAVALLVIGAAFLVFRPGFVDPASPAGAGASAPPSGQDGLGAAPSAAGTKKPGSRGAPVSASPGTSGSAAPSTPPTPQVSATGNAGKPELTAAYRAPGLLGGVYQVTVANQGAVPANGWTVIIRLSGVAVTVEPGAGVNHEVRDKQHVFTPAGAKATVPAGGSVSFTFTVNAVLPAVEACTVDGTACTAAA